MAVSAEFEQYVAEQLEIAGSVETRRMFGGVGLYLDGTFCALISSEGRVYLRVGDSNRPDFEAEGMAQFRPGSKGGGMPYYEVPPQVLEQRDELRGWALKACAAAEEAGTAKPRKAASRATTRNNTAGPSRSGTGKATRKKPSPR